MQKHLTFSLALLTLICTSAHAQLPSYLPADGLVGWWPFNGNANDESGNGNDGVVNGAVLASDRNGVENAAYDFNGNSNVTINNEFFNNGSAEYTMSLWVRIGSINSSNTFLNTIPHCGASVGYSYLGNNRFYHYKGVDPISNSVPCWTIFNQDLFNYQLSIVSQWVMISVSKVSNVYRYYVNGQLDKEATTTISPVDGYCRMIFGAIDGGSEGLTGKLDDIAIYNRALTPQEIQNLYTGTTPAACLDLPANLQDGLVGYWPFCGNANDESGNGNNGTVNGATLAADRFGNAGSAYSFDGVDDKVDACGLEMYSEFSMSLWFLANDLTSVNPTLAYFGVEGFGFDYTNSVDISFDNVNFSPPRLRANLNYDFGNAGTADFIQEWNQATFKLENSQLYFYLNGDLKDVVNTSKSKLKIDSTACSRIGCGQNSSLTDINFFNGLLDDITIYNRALTSEEVTQLYAVQSTGDPTAGGGGNTTGPLANVPRGISYQAVARDAQGQAIASSPVNVRFTLHQGTPTGATEFSETHSLTTNEIGLFNTYFGSGTAITSAFDSIVWSNTTKFLQVEIDLGNGYVDMGTQQLMSVPFAYRANEAAAAGTIRNNALPVYPDNTAALAGGLVAGEMYRTATGDLKVVY